MPGLRFVAQAPAAFASTMEKWGKREPARAASLIAWKIAIDVFASLAKSSPVLTGRYRMSHNMQEGSRNTNVAPEAKNGEVLPAPAVPKMGKVAAALSELRPIYIGNYLPYAGRLEGGWSKKAPGGIYRVVLAAFSRRGGFLREVL